MTRHKCTIDFVKLPTSYIKRTKITFLITKLVYYMEIFIYLFKQEAIKFVKKPESALTAHHYTISTSSYFRNYSYI
jgi:hypothetical protein